MKAQLKAISFIFIIFVFVIILFTMILVQARDGGLLEEVQRAKEAEGGNLDHHACLEELLKYVPLDNEHNLDQTSSQSSEDTHFTGYARFVKVWAR